MDKDYSTRKRKKSIEDSVRNVKKALKNGSGSEEEDEDLFSWEEYLKKCHAKAVPKETFKHVQDTKVQGFVPGMKLECMDRTSLETDTYWVATVVMSSGPLLLLRYDGYEDDRSGDFWCDAASEELQPIGWCARTNNILIPPAAIRHKESNWAKFLMQDLKNAVCAPEHLFHRRSDPDEENQLKPGLKLELLHADDPLSYWVASVVDAFGLRLRLRLEGSINEADDVWLYYLSDNVHQLGFGKKHNLRLNVPARLKTEYPNKDWEQVRGRLLGLCNLTTEDVSLNKTLNKSDNLPKPHGFAMGMKLEAVNPNDPSSICASTVSKVANDIFFQVEIDSMISCGDGSRPSMWCSTNSRNIFPVGWCERNNIQLTPPPGYLVHPFRWQTYLEWTNSSAAPDSLFNSEIPTHEFDIGMKFEAVDQTDPSAMTVATVTQVVGRTMWVLLDGYKDDSVEHIYDVESFDLFPVGWCSMNGHPLLTPRIQRPPEENRRLATLRATKQREIKKIASDSNVSNTANASNTSLDTTKDFSTTDTITVTAESTITVSESDAIIVSNALATGHQSPISTKDLKPTAKTEVTAVKEEKNEGLKTEGLKSEGPKTEGPKQEGLEKKVPVTPKGKYELRASTLIPRNYGIQDEDEDEEGTGKTEKVEDVAVIDLTEEEDVAAPEQKPSPPKDSSEICIYVRKSCDPGPFLKKGKITSMPSIIGPANPNSVLRQLVKQIVLSAHSSKVVLQLLASETDKMTISSIIRTLRTKLSLCENLISLKKVVQCEHCDRAKAPLSLRKNSEPAPTPVKPVTKDTTKPIKPVSPTAVAKEVSQPSSIPARSTVPVNNKPAGNPVKVATTTNTNTTPTGNPVKAAAPANANNTHAANPVKAATSASPNNKPAGVIPVPQDVPVVYNSHPEPPRSESPTAAAARIAKHITKWTVSDVVEFIRTTDCHKFADDFMRQEIDGRALTLLSLDEIHKCLGVTLGPAIKLHFSVQNLLKKHR